MTFHDRLRAVAARLCGAKTMELVIDPVLTDVENEYLNAIAEGRVWRAALDSGGRGLSFLEGDRPIRV